MKIQYDGLVCPLMGDPNATLMRRSPRGVSTYKLMYVPHFRRDLCGGCEVTRIPTATHFHETILFCLTYFLYRVQFMNSFTINICFFIKIPQNMAS